MQKDKEYSPEFRQYKVQCLRGELSYDLHFATEDELSAFATSGVQKIGGVWRQSAAEHYFEGGMLPAYPPLDDMLSCFPLAERVKLILSLYYKEEKNHREIAEALHITPERVRQIKERGQRAIKIFFSQKIKGLGKPTPLRLRYMVRALVLNGR